MRLLRNIGLGVAAAVLLAGLALWIASARMLGARPAPQPERLAAPTPAQVADAPRQLRILGCITCHGEGLRGGKVFDDPKIASIHGPNLTLVAARASDEQLARAIRQGIGADGRPLVAMPSSGFSQLTGQEVAAIIGAVRALPRGGPEAPPVRVGPIGRIGLVAGKFSLQPALVARQKAHMPADLGPEHAKARHIVVTVCAECHGPDLTGGEAEPGVMAPDLAIAGAYEPEQFRRLLREGVAPGKTLTLMRRVARSDLKYLTDGEIDSIHAYLRALSAR